jgi:hypothetical protein
MHSRWYSVAVVLLWLTTMGWLVKQKVWPSLVVGDPPDYQAILAVQKDSPPVGWTLMWNDHQTLGWAVTSTSRLPNELTEVRSHIHFAELPLSDIIPEWLSGLLQTTDARGLRVTMDAGSTLVFDPLQRLSQFESTIRFQPKADAVRMRGRIEGAKLLLTIHCGDFPPYETEVPVPRTAMLNDALSPLGYLVPRPREGQHWTMEVYSPLRPPTSPSEVLHAAVEDRTPMTWNGHLVETWLVVYRSDPGSALSGAGSPRGKLWVRGDGAVLKQQVTVLRSTLTFVRTSDEEAARLARRAGDIR